MKLKIGPGAYVTAAFIGPGTVTTCTLAGANFGFVLVWALVFATLSTILLQDMAARLGAGAQRGLGEALMQSLPSGPVRIIIAALVFIAIAIGNAAYEAGNLVGGAFGAESMLGPDRLARHWYVLAIAVTALPALIFGRYKSLERLLIGLVLIMGLAFFGRALLTRPNLLAMLNGLIPRIPEGGTLTAIALIGTTVVPYNLFLHAAAARRRWTPDQVADARADTIVSIGLGGLVSLLILATAASALFSSQLEVTNAADMARSLEPVAGPWARYLLGLGLLAAGLTSAITAPLAAGYAVSEILPGLNSTARRRATKLTSITILGIGALVGTLGIKPILLILTAQAANGLLLPLMAAFLLYVMNKQNLVGKHANSNLANLMGASVVMITFGLGLRGILRTLGLWP